MKINWKRVRFGTEAGILIANVLFIGWFYVAAVLPLKESVDTLAQVSESLDGRLYEVQKNRELGE